ncbi:MAG: hypothetical protein HRU09_03780 [Oligoflexales bacterium]|nr:hypothetical protein [Oligoflexales bacterium]
MKLFSAFMFSIMVSCASTEPLKNYGIQADYQAFIPARIAVFSCQAWPINARFSGQVPVNIKDAELDAICTQFDKFVLSSFSNQPFMKGFTPKLIKALLAKAEKEHLLNEVPQIWSHDPKECPECKNSLTTYKRSVSSNIKWQQWLNTLSGYTRYSDAALFPMVVSAFEHQFNDRGLLVSERVLELNLLLVDSNNAQLQWIGQRKAAMRAQKLQNPGDKSQYPSYPTWEQLYKRVFTEDMWQSFPGRQQ